MNYTYYRDYDPAIGRYVESDSIGLKGGTNTCADVALAPSRWSDEFGLAGRGGGFYIRYGNWCGKNWSEGRVAPVIPENPAGPIDCVDDCCTTHDYCYAKHECEACASRSRAEERKRECDMEVVSCLESIALCREPSQSTDQMPGGSGLPDVAATQGYTFLGVEAIFFTNTPNATLDRFRGQLRFPVRPSNPCHVIQLIICALPSCALPRRAE